MPSSIEMNAGLSCFSCGWLFVESSSPKGECGKKSHGVSIVHGGTGGFVRGTKMEKWESRKGDFGTIIVDKLLPTWRNIHESRSIK